MNGRQKLYIQESKSLAHKTIKQITNATNAAAAVREAQRILEPSSQPADVFGALKRLELELSARRQTVKIVALLEQARALSWRLCEDRDNAWVEDLKRGHCVWLGHQGRAAYVEAVELIEDDKANISFRCGYELTNRPRRSFMSRITCLDMVEAPAYAPQEYNG